jgi:hypothetical protein
LCLYVAEAAVDGVESELASVCLVAPPPCACCNLQGGSPGFLLVSERSIVPFGPSCPLPSSCLLRLRAFIYCAPISHCWSGVRSSVRPCVIILRPPRWLSAADRGGRLLHLLVCGWSGLLFNTPETFCVPYVNQFRERKKSPQGWQFKNPSSTSTGAS